MWQSACPNTIDAGRTAPRASVTAAATSAASCSRYGSISSPPGRSAWSSLAGGAEWVCEKWHIS